MNILLQESDDILVIGPTAGMIPDAFFKRGVTVMGGILVTKPDELLDVISEAAQVIISSARAPKE